MNILKSALVASALLGAAYSYAVPAYPGAIDYLLPDGSSVKVMLRGDEHSHYILTTDGYTLLADQQGYLNFATQESDGSLKASAIRFTGSSLPARQAGITPGITDTSAKRKAGSNLQVDVSFPTKGERKLLMLLVNFSDTQTTYTKEDFEALMNAEGYKGGGSFRDFYLENSYGQLDVTTTVTDWIQLPYPKNYYGADGAQNLIRDALTMVSDQIDFTQFDNDGDGVLDGLAVIHQGGGQEYTGSGYDIWSHSSEIYGLSIGGVEIANYTIEPEVLGYTGKMSTIGVICHEFGHNLGAPDFYDTDYSTGGSYGGTGVWDIMGSGAWNGDYGDQPTNVNMWQKIQYGWVTPTLLDATQEVRSLKPASTHPQAYRVETGIPGEYYILENRQQIGRFDISLPGSGLIVYHADESLISSTVAANTLNATYPQAMYTVCASAKSDPVAGSPDSYGSLTSAGAPFPGSYEVHEISDETLPSLRPRSGRDSYKAIKNITETSEGFIDFDFVQLDTPTAPTALSATAERGKIKLSWQFDEVPDDFDHFNVYRNNTVIAETTDLSYTDSPEDASGTITYYVDAAYTSGSLSPFVSTEISLPANFAITPTAQIIEQGEDTYDVQLKWSAGTSLTRVKGLDKIDIVNHNLKAIDYVHRFTADDLSIYNGYTIKRVGFLPYSGPKVLSFTLRVWQAEADGSNPRIISERKVSEFGTANWNDILLTTPVKIDTEAQAQLWLGVHCETTDEAIQIVSDMCGDGKGLGNWIKESDEEGWKADTKSEGNYLLRFTLSEPDIDYSSPVEIPEGDINPDIDLEYPLGFRIYRDDECIGTSTTRTYFDRSAPAGTHTYSIASLYKGNNESVAASVEATVPGNSSVSAIATQSGLKVSNNGGLLHISGAQGTITVYSLHGLKVAQAETINGAADIALPGGFYILKSQDHSIKLLIQ